MAIITEKLYPPYIEGAIPAFYANDEGTAKIAVPFSMNRTVSKTFVTGLRLKIKLAQSNTYIKTLDCIDVDKALNTLIAEFEWPGIEEGTGNNDAVAIGQYLKFQLAYLGRDEGVGYFSTVAIGKYTAKPTLLIADMNVSTIALHKHSYVGIYQQENDISEKAYAYKFKLFDSANKEVESSEWLPHNSSIEMAESQIDALFQSIDTYSFKTNLIPNLEYKIQYFVKTINNLEVESPQYTCMAVEGVRPEITAKFVATNIFEEGYIQLHFYANEYIDDRARGNYIIMRTDNRSSYQNWDEIKKVSFLLSQKLSNWEFRDFTVEQGIYYKYSIQQYNNNGLYSERIVTNIVMADFEDMFLYDGNRQLKLRFNPKVTSFKINRLEQKIETIGSKYPFIFRNGKVEYKEFPIGGLISYLSDNNHLFMQDDNLGIENDINLKRTNFYFSNLQVRTTNLVDYNVTAERIFRTEVLEWLNDGQSKIFKSPTEGNFLIRLLNISMTPEDQVGRLIYNMSATACEVGEFNYKSLLNQGFINLNAPVQLQYSYDTVRLFDPEYGVYHRGIVNRYPIAGQLAIYDALPGSHIQIGQSWYTIGYNGALQLDLGDETIPDVYVIDGTNMIGSVTYRYRLTSSLSKFNLIKNISIENRIEEFSGPMNVSAQLVNNRKQEFSTFYALHFKEKEVRPVYYRGGIPTYNNLFTDPNFTLESKLTYLDENVLYYIRLNESDSGMYGIAENNHFTLTTYENRDLKITVDDTTFIGVPLIKFYPGNYSNVTIGNGIILDCSYQIRLIDYEIEDIDSQLKDLRARKNNIIDDEYLRILEEKLQVLESNGGSE